uniref:SH2 domain-containing protein n=1 Tax=Timema douglasi TaxID=61478 RepID=A0A7R8VN06_TIMDO|nr:unnamed protein product [Timema douglasi]
MGRDRASALLERHMDGTYLLRVRPQGATHPNETIYALSLKTDDRVKHMKVYERTMEGVPHYYLSESRFFRSITDLIGCYEHSSLGENFVGLDVTLKWPFRRIIAIAEFDFNPSESNQLPLRKGCQVIVLSKEGDYKGWWKGKVQDRRNMADNRKKGVVTLEEKLHAIKQTDSGESAFELGVVKTTVDGVVSVTLVRAWNILLDHRASENWEQLEGHCGMESSTDDTETVSLT